VNHNAAVGQGEAFAFFTGGQQKCPHAGGLAETQGRYVGFDKVHGVVNRHARRYGAARRIDVKENIFVGIFAFQKQQLRHDQIGGLVVHRTDQKYDAFFEQT
jgi:hypothetical protein